MRTPVFCLLTAAALLGCSPVATQSLQQGATASRSCISLTQVAGRRAVGPQAVLFETVGPTNYLNQLRGPCPPLARLRSTATISVASGGNGGQLCSGDRIRVFDPAELQGRQLTGYPTCVLGDFIAEPARR
jgi:hypothetical protein